MRQRKPAIKQIISAFCISFFIVAFGLLCLVNYMLWQIDSATLIMSYKIAVCVLSCLGGLSLVRSIYRWSDNENN